MQRSDDGKERWLDEGGNEPAHVARAMLVAEVADAGEAQRADLWETAVAEYGDEVASRIWQEALSSGDASDT
jgi:hypothetical protein